MGKSGGELLILLGPFILLESTAALDTGDHSFLTHFLNLAFRTPAFMVLYAVPHL